MMIGTLYDGNRKRLIGHGPETFTSTLDRDLYIKVMLRVRTKNPSLEAKLQSEDRLWALPDALDLKQGELSVLLTDLASRIKAGNRVGLAARNEAVIATARNALMMLIEGRITRKWVN